VPEPSSSPEPEPTPAPEPEPNQGSKQEPNPAPETNPTAEAESTAATDPTPADNPGAAPADGTAPDPSEAPVPAAPASDPKYEHPKRNVPDNWVESIRKKLKKGSWWRKQFDTLACPVAEPSEFRVSEAELVRQLTPPDGDEAERASRAAEILEEARNIY
jgi:hypothetical protein